MVNELIRAKKFVSNLYIKYEFSISPKILKIIRRRSKRMIFFTFAQW